MISFRPKKPSNQGEEVIVPKEFPGVSTYYKTKVIHCFPAIKMDKINKIFLFKTWRYKPVAPCIIMFCAIFFFTMTTIFLFPNFGFEGKIANGVSAFLLLLFFIAYLHTIVVGPGFFPFYWSEQNRQQAQINNNQSNNESLKEELLHTQNIDSNYDPNPLNLNLHDDNSPSGIITSDDQLHWARSKPRPPRSIISREAGRIVIRPDHFCAITFCWIGKRNQKFFILFNLYASLFSFQLCVYSLRLIIGQFRNGGWCWRFDFLFSFITVLVGLNFGGMSLLFWIASCRYVIKGYTIHEELMGIDKKKFDRGCAKNCEDVFGSCLWLPCWLCPADPWRSKTNDELVKNYVSYYDETLFTNPK